MFEKASRLRLRFNYKGLIAVEDLWSLSVENLDNMFKDLNRLLRDRQGESLLEETSRSDPDHLELKIDIIKHIVKVKLEEKKTQEEKLLRLEKKKKILQFISEKQDEELRGKSVKDLEKLLEGL